MIKLCEVKGSKGRKIERFLLIEEIENSEDVLIKVRIQKKYIELLMKKAEEKNQSIEEIIRKPIENRAKRYEIK